MARIFITTAEDGRRRSHARNTIVRQLVLLAALVLIALPAAAIDPPLTLVRYGVAPVGGTPVVASNGSDFLLVWLSGNRINVLRPSMRHSGGLATPVAHDAISMPSLAWSGSRFATVYSVRGGSALVMLDGDGNVVAPPRMIHWNYSDGAPQVGWDGKHFIVVYLNYDYPKTLYGQLLTSDGRSEGAPTTIWTEPTPHYYGLPSTIRVASNGDGFLIAFAPPGEARLFAIGGDGTVLNQTQIAVTYGSEIGIATDGHDYLVAWPGASATYSQLPPSLYGSVVSPYGLPRAARRQVIALARSVAGNPAITWNGSSYIVAFTDFAPLSVAGQADGDVYIRHVAADGTPLGATVAIATGDRSQNAPSVASTGAGDVIAFADARFTLDDPRRYPRLGGVVRALNIGPDDTLAPLAGLGADGIASLGAADQDLVAAATGTLSTLVVWRETLGTTRSLRYGRLSRDNQWLDGEGNTIDASPDASPSVASSGEMFLVLWAEKGRVRMTRIDRNGGLIDPKPVDLAEQRTDDDPLIAVAWIRNAFVVVHTEEARLVARRIDRDGIVLDSRVIRPRIDRDRALLPAALFNGQTLLVVYKRLSPCPFPKEYCFAEARTEAIALDVNLEPREPRPVLLDDLDEVSSHPSIAWSGSAFAVVWPSFREIRTAALDIDGRLLGRLNAFGETFGRSFSSTTTSVAWNAGAFRLIFDADPDGVSEIALDKSAFPTGPERPHPDVSDTGGPASAGALAFYPARIDEAPWYGASRILTTTAPFAAATDSNASDEPRKMDTGADVAVTPSCAPGPFCSPSSSSSLSPSRRPIRR
jgi:hypothetical protein